MSVLRVPQKTQEMRDSECQCAAKIHPYLLTLPKLLMKPFLSLHYKLPCLSRSRIGWPLYLFPKPSFRLPSCSPKSPAIILGRIAHLRRLLEVLVWITLPLADRELRRAFLRRTYRSRNRPRVIAHRLLRFLLRFPLQLWSLTVPPRSLGTDLAFSQPKVTGACLVRMDRKNLTSTNIVAELQNPRRQV